ncbi:hypothetical protein JX266_003889 [Neoarthrinium moseri]|nr:hypothetical protein JX266_003889 [Neoarthrinium moseri]
MEEQPKLKRDQVFTELEGEWIDIEVPRTASPGVHMRSSHKTRAVKARGKRHVSCSRGIDLGRYNAETREIIIFKKCEGQHLTYDEMLLTLVHEMVHAFLDSFADYDSRTYKKAIMANEWHGTVFRQLNGAIMREIGLLLPNLDVSSLGVMPHEIIMKEWWSGYPRVKKRFIDAEKRWQRYTSRDAKPTNPPKANGKKRSVAMVNPFEPLPLMSHELALVTPSSAYARLSDSGKNMRCHAKRNDLSVSRTIETRRLRIMIQIRELASHKSTEEGVRERGLVHCREKHIRRLHLW